MISAEFLPHLPAPAEAMSAAFAVWPDGSLLQLADSYHVLPSHPHALTPPLECGGHGTCGGPGICTCNGAFEGRDCSVPRTADPSPQCVYAALPNATLPPAWPRISRKAGE